MSKRQIGIVHEDADVLVMWVSGQVMNIQDIITWIGGFFCPNYEGSLQYSCMITEPAGSVEGDIFLFLCDDPADVNSEHYKIAEAKVKDWDITYID